MSWLAPLAQAWLVAVTTGLGLPLGAWAILMIHKLTGGLWGREAGPALRRIAGLLPVMLLCGLPLIGAIELLLPFLAQPPDALPPRVAAKLGYLQPIWIVVRTVIVSAMWLGGWRLWDRSGAASVIGLVCYMLGLMVFTTDWMQALDPAFYSTIYPVEVAGAQILGAFALTILLVPFDVKGDFGKLLLAALLSWAYFAAMQWVISWMGDLPDEAAWYLERTKDWWGAVLVLALALFGIVPFFALLLRRVRGSLLELRIVAWMVLVGYMFESVWHIAPAFPANPLVLVGLLMVGAIFYILLRRQSPAPQVAHG
jgi:hypothetical protein